MNSGACVMHWSNGKKLMVQDSPYPKLMQGSGSDTSACIQREILEENFCAPRG